MLFVCEDDRDPVADLFEDFCATGGELRFIELSLRNGYDCEQSDSENYKCNSTGKNYSMHFFLLRIAYLSDGVRIHFFDT
jgi:hypothetical protein